MLLAAKKKCRQSFHLSCELYRTKLSLCFSLTEENLGMVGTEGESNFTLLLKGSSSH